MANDIHEIVNKIDTYSDRIAEMLAELDAVSEAAALAESDYDKQLGLITEKMEDEKKYRAEPAKLIAKGRAADYKATMKVTEYAYKGLLAKIRGAETVLSAQQTKFRHLDTGVG
jgi:hypothetical protein